MIRLQNGVSISPAIETRCAAAPSWRASLVVAPSIASSAVRPRSAQVPCSRNGIGSLLRPLGPLRNCDFRVGTLAGSVSGLTMPNTDGWCRTDHFRLGVRPFSSNLRPAAPRLPLKGAVSGGHTSHQFICSQTQLLRCSRTESVRHIRPLSPLP
jgi:hypothetical protein